MTRLIKNSLFATIFLLAIFLSVLLRDEPKLQTPLVNMGIESITPKNAALVTNAPVITNELINDVKKGNYVLQGSITVPKGISIKIEEGTVFYANRDAKIIVLGEIVAEKISWLSNQAYSQRRYWHGLTAEQNGKITLRDSNIQDTTTALTALSGGELNFSGLLTNNVVGIALLEKGTASINNVRVSTGTVGIQMTGGVATINEITFEKLLDGLRIFHGSKIAINKPRFLQISGKFIKYLAEPNLTITNIYLGNSIAFSSVTYDGNNQPTHTWRGKEFKTGTVSYSLEE
jgi:hypothetical protein